MEPFEPFRVVGSVCGNVPISYTNLYGSPILMVATGRTFQLFKGKELAMIRGGPTYLHPIRSIAQSGKYRFVAEGPRIHALLHHKPLWMEYHEAVTRPEVMQMLAQDDLLFCLGEDKRIVVREVKTGRILQQMLVTNSESVTNMALVSGYSNKLLACTKEGTLHLYNYQTGTSVWHSVKSAHQILSLACSRYKDIVAYGTSDGKVTVLNVATDEVITVFENHEGAAVTALAFRADKDSFLVSGTSTGDVFVWDLANRCMDGALTRSKQARAEAEVLENPHTDMVHSLVIFTQPELGALLVTGGSDNALLQFRFDTVDGLGVLVRERRGHMGSCTVAHFYNTDLLVTAGNDRALRVTHVFSDRASWELSQGRLGKKGREKQMGREALKMPPASAVASCTTRNYQWASVVSLHMASSQACSWRMDTRALDFKLSGINTSCHTARAVAMSDCGNYAVVGYSSGNVAIINLQNRSIRQLFDLSRDSHSDRSHESSVECVDVACGNTAVLTAGLDGNIKIWDLHTSALKATLRTGQPITKSVVHQGASLYMVAQHFTIRVYHCNVDVGLGEAELTTPVRQLDGHTAPITAMALAPDSNRYLASASGDGALLLWDLAAAACVGQYRFASPALSLSFHPDALFLATTHAGERGAYLWVNNLRYGYVPEVVARPLERAVESLPLLHYPTAHGGEEEVDAEGAAKGELTADEKTEIRLAVEEAARDAQEETDLFDATRDVALIQAQKLQSQWSALDAIRTEGLRLAGVPRATVFNLTVLDQIKEKNQPLLPPQKKDVPFFLPTTQQLRPTFIVAASQQPKVMDGSDPKPLVCHADLTALTEVQRMLLAGDFDRLMAHFIQLRTASAIDLELKRVVEYVEGSTYTKGELDRMRECLKALLNFIRNQLQRGDNVDLVQGILADVIRSHGPLITYFGDALVPEMQSLAVAQNRIRYNVDHLVSFPSCLAGTFAGTSV